MAPRDDECALSTTKHRHNLQHEHNDLVLLVEGQDDSTQETTERSAEDVNINHSVPVTQQQALPIVFYPHYLHRLDQPAWVRLQQVLLLWVILDLLFMVLLSKQGGPVAAVPALSDERRHILFNRTVHHVNVLGTILNVLPLPWRYFQYIQLSRHASYPESTVIWWQYSQRVRAMHVYLLLAASVFQFVNHASHIVYPDYDSSHSSPGSFWTIVFLVCHVACLVIVLLYTVWEVLYQRYYLQKCSWATARNHFGTLLQNAPQEGHHCD